MAAPILSGAGSWQDSVGFQVFGSQASLIGYPVSAVLLNGVRRVTITTTDATLPQVSISDDDGSTFVSLTGQPANQAQWTAVAILARPSGGNKIHIVFPNAVQKGTSPNLLIEDFNPVGQ